MGLFKHLHTLCVAVMLLLLPGMALAQGVTSSSMIGRVTDGASREGLIGANVVAIHLPSGTVYGNSTDVDGYFRMPGMRVGGPYKVTITYTGYEEQSIENIYLSLGTAATLDFALSETAVLLGGIEVVANRNDIFSGDRNGAGTNINSQTIQAFPTLSRGITDFTRLTPQANGTSFAGQDNRLNNITLDGASLNNSFGLAGLPGGRTGIAPVSLDAIEEIQVNLSPFDVRQAGFVGAGINAITRAGTNEFTGSVYAFTQNESWVGTKARENDIVTTEFANNQYGFRLGGPIIKNKLFFFVNGEVDRQSSPFNLRANRGEAPEGNITSVLASDLDAVSNFLRDNYGYETGPYEGYDLETRGDKITARLDYNLNQGNKISLRYNYLNSSTDVPISNSSSLGFGSRRDNNSLSYRNSNYLINDDIQSIVGEWNSIISSKVSNSLTVGYTYQNEDRGSYGQFFPLIEIQNNGQTYISTGTEPFTPNNQLSYKTFQIQNNLSIYAGKHTYTAGFNLERLSFRNVFFPGSQGVFVYNSIDDFYTDLNGFVDNPDRTTSPVDLRRFQYRYSALPGGAEPVQPTKVTYAGVYVQDEIQATDRLNLSIGVRADVPFFDETGFENKAVTEQTYLLEGENIQINTAKLPDAKVLFSPRLGFNYDLTGDRKVQLRGGTGLFTGRPVFVWISNQIGNNGVLTGFEQIDNTNTRPFTTNPGQFITNPSLPSSYELAITAPDFKFLQVWRSNLAIDAKLPGGLIGTLEAIYGGNVNAVRYYNVNEEPSNGATFTGPDNRPRFPGVGLSGGALNSAVRINDNTVNAIYLDNTNEGYSFSFTAQLEKPFKNGFARVAYNYGQAQDLMSAGSIAAGSYNGIASVNGNNNVELAFSDNEQRHRIIAAVSKRFDYADFTGTEFALFLQAGNQGRYTFTYSQDMNGDGINNNDLIFRPITNSSGTVLFTPEQQVAAFEAFIQQDEYLSSRRGQYAERNGGMLPWLTRADFSVMQNFYLNVGGKRNTLQIRLDIRNVTNLINSDWGVSQSVVNSRPLIAAGTTSEGVPQFRMATRGSALLADTYQYNANISDTYQFQLGVRYIFN